MSKGTKFVLSLVLVINCNLMKKVILLGLMLVSFVGYPQEPNIDDLDEGEVVIDISHSDINDPNQIHTVVEVLPEYPGGIQEFYKYIAQNYRIPNELQKTGANGAIYINFVVEKDGSLSDIKVVRDLGYGTGAEAIRVLKLAGKWKAGLIDEKPVRVHHMLPIRLAVEAEQKVESKE